MGQLQTRTEALLTQCQELEPVARQVQTLGEERDELVQENALLTNVPESAKNGLSQNPKVERLGDNGVVTFLDQELDDSWGVKRIAAATVHNNPNEGEGIRVGVPDTGIDYQQPDLDGK